MIGYLWTRVRKQPIIVLYVETSRPVNHILVSNIII